MIYKCAGYRRIDPDTGKPYCNYESTQPWPAPYERDRRCPSCRQPFDCKPIGIEAGNKKKLKTAADAEVVIKKTKTGIAGLDSVLTGGLALSQIVLLAGPAGCRKSSMSAEVLEGLSKHTRKPLLYVSGEQNDDGVKQIFQLVNVTSDQVKIMGNAMHVEDVLHMCSELKPLCCVFDSVQALSRNSGMTEEDIAHQIMRYCKKTKMMAIVIGHMSGSYGVKGGTGPAHYVDTVVVFEPYVPGADGNLEKMFGRQQLNEVGLNWRLCDEDDHVENLKVLMIRDKNRYGAVGNRAYYYSTPDGPMVELKKLTGLELVR